MFVYNINIEELVNKNVHYYHKITGWYIGMWGPVPSRPSGRYRVVYQAFINQLRKQKSEAARKTRQRVRVERKLRRAQKKWTCCAVTQAPGRVQCCEAWRSGRRGQRRERPQVRSGGGGISVLLGVSSLAYCYISEIRQAVVRRPPRENVESKIRLAISVLFTVI